MKHTSAKLSGAVNTLGNYAFENCTSLASVEIRMSMQSIPYACFRGCTSLRTVQIEGSYLRTIADSAFEDCVSLSSIGSLDGLTSLGGSAFRNCRSLETFSFGNSIGEIGDGAWAGCTSLRKITFGSDYGGSFRIVGGILHTNSYLSKMLWIPPTTSGAFQVPNSVTELSSRIFEGCAGITKITLPAGIVSLRPFSLSNIPGVQTLEMSTSALPRLKDALYGSPAPRRLVFLSESNPTIPADTLNELPGLAYVKLPPGLKTLPAETFKNCPDLDAVVLPAALDIIADRAFAGCQKLRSLTVPASVYMIGSGAFSGSALERLAFLGEAPGIEETPFTTLPASFRTYFFNSAAGFSTPRWMGREAVDMGANVPDKLWRVENRLPHDVPLENESKGGGGKLLTAYGLMLDPYEPLGPQLPMPTIANGRMTLRAWRATTGATYFFETSTDLVNWTTGGVTLSTGNTTNASVPMGPSRRYMRVRMVK